MKVERDNQIYDVLEYDKNHNEVLVEDEFNFYHEPYKRKIRMWWDLKTCRILLTNNQNNNTIQET